MELDKNNIVIRSISGIILSTICIIAIFLFRPLFYVLCYVAATLMLIEWYNMTSSSKPDSVIGLVLIPLSIASLLTISRLDSTGWLLLTFFAIICSVDTMAMFGGKLIGGPKLAPNISPNKTVSGLVIGVVSAVIIVNLLTLIPVYHLPYMLPRSNLSISALSLLVAVVAQLSDLLISCFKRKFNIKDTGNIIPGHGGALDRFDSIILTAPLIALYLISNS